MARITVEDCLKQVNNRFSLIHLAAKRVRQLRKGAEPLVVSKNKDIVVALREIAGRKVIRLDPEEMLQLTEAGPEDVVPETSPEADAPLQDEAKATADDAAPEKV